jgi:hypothetical protein
MTRPDSSLVDRACDQYLLINDRINELIERIEYLESEHS